MRPYKVEGAAVQISPSTALILSASQVAARKHQVKEVKKVGKDGIRVEALAMLTFKVGEVIGLAEVPKQATAHLVDIYAVADAERAAVAKAAQEARDAERAKATRDKFVGEATKAFAGSSELQGKYADADAYIAVLDAEQQAHKAAS